MDNKVKATYERRIVNKIGIDVGAKQFHVALIQKGEIHVPVVFENSVKGIEAIKTYLRKNKVKQVVLEATGVYHLDLALALTHLPTVEVMVLNPKAANHYAQLHMTRNKTDKVDAKLLAHYAQYMPFEPWQAPSEVALALRACSRRLSALSEQKVQAKNQLHAFQASSGTPKFVIEDVHLSIEQLQAQIDKLERYTLALIEQETALLEMYTLACSIKGIAHKSAIQLLGELLVLPEDMKAKQWVAMAGLDPRHHSSGSSVHKKPRLSKAGNSYLRKALYMPALCATRHIPQVKAYYQHLIEDQGLKKIQAICAVMRKLLHAIHGMWRSHETFDPSRFYAMESVSA